MTMRADRPVPSGQNAKVLIVTAIITAATTIGVSFIGIVPQLRQGDALELKQLKSDLEELKRASSVGARDVELTKTLTISGTVRSADGSQFLKGYDIYLLPEGNNLLTAKTDDTGRFTFLRVPDGTYSIIVRDSTNGKSGKGLLDDESDEVEVIGARVRYRIGR